MGQWDRDFVGWPPPAATLCKRNEPNNVQIWWCIQSQHLSVFNATNIEWTLMPFYRLIDRHRRHSKEEEKKSESEIAQTWCTNIFSSCPTITTEESPFFYRAIVDIALGAWRRFQISICESNGAGFLLHRHPDIRLERRKKTEKKNTSAREEIIAIEKGS